jgi:hypothetical protein
MSWYFNVRGSLLDGEFIHIGERNGPERKALCSPAPVTQMPPLGHRRVRPCLARDLSIFQSPVSAGPAAATAWHVCPAFLPDLTSLIDAPLRTPRFL